MFTSSNCRLIKVKFRQRPEDGPLSVRGETTWTEVDLVVSHPTWLIKTWVDFSIVRRAEMRGDKIDIDGIWEMRGWVYDKVYELTGKYLQTGDLVQFDIRSDWFAITMEDEDRGIFNSIPVTKVTLKKSLKNRSSC